MLNLLHISVLDEDSLNIFIEEDGYKYIKDIPFDEAQSFDYAQTALVDKDEKHILYWNDNIHCRPDLYVEAFLEALRYAGVEYSCEKIVMIEEDLKDYSGKTYR